MVDEKKMALQQFSDALNKAGEQKVSKEKQAAYDQGIQQTKDLVMQINMALNANDVDKANQLTKKLIGAKKEYHKKLGVKK